MNRRGFLTGGASLILAAPAVIRIPELLMPIKAPILTDFSWIRPVGPNLLSPGHYSMVIDSLTQLAEFAHHEIVMSFRVGDVMIKHPMRLT